jgi:hypothetical protein
LKVFAPRRGPPSLNAQAGPGTARSASSWSAAGVERSLYRRAVGYHYDAVKIFMPSGADKPVYAPYVEHVP